MKQKKLFIFIQLFTVLSACDFDNKNTHIITEFPKKKEIEITVIETAPVILAPEEMFIMNDQIWVFQSKKDSLFDVFALPNCNYLFSTGRKGQGPDEFIFPIGKTIQTNDSGFTILDANFIKFVSCQSNGALYITHSIKTFDHLAVNGFIRLNDSLVCAFTGCATGSSSDFEYQMKNLYSKKVIEFSSYPKLTTKEYEGEQRCQIYYKHLTANPNERKMAAFYSFFKYFRIYSYDGVLEKEVSVKIPSYKSDNVEDWEKRNVYYGKPVATEKYIYVPCMGNEIQVWDWNGNPIIQFSLNQTFCTFAVSENRKKIYLISANEDDYNKIFTFDISYLY